MIVKEEFLSRLRKIFDLNLYEVKVWTALLSRGVSTAGDLSDIADVLGFSRQNMRKLMINNRASFPLPIHEGKAAIWHLSNVLSWCREGNRYQVNEFLQDVAKANMQLNITKEIENIDPLMNSKISAVL